MSPRKKDESFVFLREKLAHTISFQVFQQDATQTLNSEFLKLDTSSPVHQAPNSFPEFIYLISPHKYYISCILHIINLDLTLVIKK